MQAEAPSGESAIVAILRGLTPARAADVAALLYRAGIRIIEVPLNSPDPFTSIAQLAALQLPNCLIGAGTVPGAPRMYSARTRPAAAWWWRRIANLP